MKKSAILLGVLIAGSVQASESPEWNRFEASFVKSDVKEMKGVDIDGFGVKGTYLTNPNHFVVGQAYDLSGDANIDTDMTSLSLGTGYVRDISRTTDVYSTLTVEYLDIDPSVQGVTAVDSEFGIGLGIGVRSMVESNTEIGAKIDYVHVDNYEEVSLKGEIYHYINQDFALGGQYKISDDADTMHFTLRYNF